jgi:outer membrane protein assembly factor BamB
MRALLAAVLCSILNLAIPVFVKTQDKPAFDKPFKVCRIFESSNDFSQVIASDNNKSLVFINKENFIVSINPETKLENWKSEIAGKLHPAIVSDTESLYYLSSFSNETQEIVYILNSVSQKTGLNNWQKRITGYTNLKLSDVFDKSLVYLSAESRNILAIKKNDGNQQWITNVKPRIITIDSTEDESLNVLTEESLLKMSSRNGETLSETKIKNSPSSNSIKNKDYVLLGYPNGEFIKISALEKVSGTLWKIKAGGGISSLIEIDGKTLVSSLDNFLYLYSTDNGKLKWKRRVSGRINIKPVVNENFAIVLSSSDNIASIVELDGGKIVNQIIIEEGNYFSEKPSILEEFIIFPTFRGIYVFTNSDLECKQ